DSSPPQLSRRRKSIRLDGERPSHGGRRRPRPRPPEVPMSFALLKDSDADIQTLIRNDHVSAVEIKKEDQSIVVYLLGGQTLHLTHEQSRQFIHHLKAHMHPIQQQ